METRDIFAQIFQAPTAATHECLEQERETADRGDNSLWRIIRRKTQRNVRHDIVDAFMEEHAAIRALETDWDGMGALPITERTWQAAIAAMETIYSGPDKLFLNLPNLSPTPKGGLLMQWETKGGFLLLHIAADGETQHLTARLNDGSKMDAPFQGAPIPSWARPIIRRP